MKIDKYLVTEAKSSLKVGDTVTATKGYRSDKSIGVIDSITNDKASVLWTYSTSTTEPLSNLKQTAKSKHNLKLGDRVKEKGGFVKVGVVYSLKTPTDVEIEWNVGTYSIENYKDLVKI